MSDGPERSLDWRSLFGLAPLLMGIAVEVGWILRDSLTRSSRGADQKTARLNLALQLCRAVVGNEKSAVTAVFGPPHASAGFSAVAPAMLVATDYQHAETWYYPLDRRGRTAMAVRFDRGIAREAHLVNFHVD